ncbi:hypothetical protein R3398_07750 [Rossellomorea marisflavi]|nr:hypothetical protein [Rossellomorea marisflavi]MDW4526259.1 hypothetical protein [Rossellomorea marisflavi]WJV17343.1 hypothetical protein QU593_14395 [Rossellomorea marisflavi]
MKKHEKKNELNVREEFGLEFGDMNAVKLMEASRKELKKKEANKKC